VPHKHKNRTVSVVGYRGDVKATMSKASALVREGLGAWTNEGQLVIYASSNRSAAAIEGVALWLNRFKEEKTTGCTLREAIRIIARTSPYRFRSR
jgi:hypothetical protein